MLTDSWNAAADILRDRRIAPALVFAADPAHQGVPPPGALSAEDGAYLIDQARGQAVLPAVLRSLRARPDPEPAFAQALSDGAAQARLFAAHSMMLRGFADALLRDLAGEPVVLVKGLAFARAIYPDPQLRPFTDIDLVLAPEARPRVEEALAARGFAFAEHDIFGTAKWVHRQNDALMVELQPNLVQSHNVQTRMSLSYADLACVGANTPAAHLMIAAVHGAAQHQFENLRQAVDILQAARGIATVADERQVEAIVARTRGRLAVVASLELAWRLFGDPRCREIARGLGPVRFALPARLLLTRAAILSTSTPRAVYYKWRRPSFRALLLRGQPVAKESPRGSR